MPARRARPPSAAFCPLCHAVSTDPAELHFLLPAALRPGGGRPATPSPPTPPSSTVIGASATPTAPGPPLPGARALAWRGRSAKGIVGHHEDTCQGRFFGQSNPGSSYHGGAWDWERVMFEVEQLTKA